MRLAGSPGGAGSRYMLQVADILVLLLGVGQGRRAESLASKQKQKCIKNKSLSLPSSRVLQLEEMVNSLKGSDGSKAPATINSEMEPSGRIVRNTY